MRIRGVLGLLLTMYLVVEAEPTTDWLLAFVPRAKRGKAQQTFDARVKSLAKTFKLATREEVSELKQTIRTLESALKQVQSQVANGSQKKSA